MKKHAGIILVPEKVFLQWLDFDKGMIHYISVAPEYMNRIHVVIEHPDMPEVEEASALSIVTLEYLHQQYGKRIFPKKHNPLMRLLRKFL